VKEIRIGECIGEAESPETMQLIFTYKLSYEAVSFS
jgi:hypothetical protein